jgi:hypothetical protein
MGRAMRVWARDRLIWKGNNLHVGHSRKPILAIEPDAKWPGMWRVRHPDGTSDMVNLSRAKDAATAIGRRILQAQETAKEGRTAACQGRQHHDRP